MLDDRCSDLINDKINEIVENWDIKALVDNNEDISSAMYEIAVTVASLATSDSRIKSFCLNETANIAFQQSLSLID